MTFASRQQAGQLLGRHLVKHAAQADLILGLPRGGVVVAAEVARALNARLDVLIVRKIGHPFYREFAVGAMAENGIVLLDPSAPANTSALDTVVAEETARLKSYQDRLGVTLRPPLHGMRLILVDDGLATGATMDAAVRSAKSQDASHVTVAVPVASTNAIERLRQNADEIVSLFVDPLFDAVGRYYELFDQTEDDEVLRLLRDGRD